ncbi:MAG TPA: Hsp20/alpha crystallin family protein [Natrialbaceae archaeon]|nr:Hsp20/alpha crystallin family protein [Natrialbaceae archaeon]
MSSRRNPFEDLERLFERMSRQFDEASRMWETGDPFGGLSLGFEPMAVDLVEHDDEFVATVDLPGFDKEDVTVHVVDRSLRIEAEREEAVEEDARDYIRQEREHKSTGRSIHLPNAVDEERVTARMKNGVLTVTLPKLEVEESHRIEIE